MWIEQDASCPTCRRRILPRMSHRQRRTHRATVMGPFLRDLLSLFDRGGSDDRPQQAAENQQAIRNMLVRLRQHRAARGVGPAFDLTVRITFGSNRHMAQISPPSSTNQNHAVNCLLLFTWLKYISPLAR